MIRVIITGYMGAGKTTVGKALSRELGLPFYDLDRYIETRMHRTIPEIFAQQGEEGFRKIEHNMLHEVAEFEDVIISCGGGTPCFFDNMEYMTGMGDTIYLKATVDVIWKHIHMGRTVRPLLLGKTEEEAINFITKQLEEREYFYLKARHIVDVNILDSYEKINIIVRRIREMLNL